MIMQRSVCFQCRKEVSSDSISEGRAIFHCSCGRRWIVKAYYGKKMHTFNTELVVSGTVLGAMAGGLIAGPVGAVVGSLIAGCVSLSGAESEVTSQCLYCGSTGRPTGIDDSMAMFQCENCHHRWRKKLKS